MRDQLPNLLSLRFKDVDDRNWTLKRAAGRQLLLMLVQGPDAQHLDHWVIPTREALGDRPVLLQPVVDSSVIPRMLWWGVKKMKGQIMREIRPDGLPRVLIDADGAVFRALRCMPGHINFVLGDAQGEVIRKELASLVEQCSPRDAVAAVLGA